MSARIFTDQTFQTDALSSPLPVLVDLSAPWCGPCRALAPVVDELAREFEGRAVVGTMNTDENPETPAQLRVSAIPTLLFVKGGKVVDVMVGARPKAQIKARLEGLLS